MKALVSGNTVIEISEVAFEVHPDAQWMDAPEGCEAGWVLENGQLVEPPPPPSLPYDEARERAYPSLGEQLDMMYWDKVNGTQNWEAAIESVKETNPKPQ